MENENEKELEKKAADGTAAGIIGNAVLLLALGIAISVTKGRILRKLL